MGNIWGTVGLSDKVYDELLTRGTVLSNENKSADQIVYLNSNKPWVRLQSGVDVQDSSAVAKRRVFTGGQVGNRQGINLAGSSEEGKYYIGSFGIRPIPGITGVSVKCKDQNFGAILEATVKLKVWSLEDLEELDEIYFRPGFTAVLEWGWTLVWSGNKLIVDPPKVIDYFEPGYLTEFQKKVPDLRNPNHEILLGYITNFSYSFNASDGSYDCSVTLLGLGSVLESLKISAVHKASKTEEERQDSDKDITTAWISPIIEDIQTETEKGNIFYNLGGDIHTNLIKFSGEDDQIKGNLQIECYHVALKLFQGRETVAYMRFEDLLRMVNSYDLKGNNTNFTFATSDIKDEAGNSIYDNNYLTFPAQFSLDPYKVVVPERVEKVSNRFYKQKEDLDRNKEAIIAGPETHELATGFEGNLGGKPGRIYDLWVSLNYLRDEIYNEIESNEKTFTIFGYMKALLGGINKALGNRNSLDIGIDENRGKFYIVDRNYIKADQELSEISISGLDTTVLKVEANSEVTDDVVNSMSIAAQGGKTVATSLVTWNKGLKERHPLPPEDLTKSGAEDGKSPTEEIDQVDFWKTANKLYKRMFSGKRSGSGGSNVSEISNDGYIKLQLPAETIFAEDLQISQNETRHKVAEGVFPIKLKLTFRGIAGFIIGECFKVKPGILPRKYKNWGYIVTGIEHNVDLDGWTTTIQTQYYPDKEEDREPSKQRKSEMSLQEIDAVSGADLPESTREQQSKQWKCKIFTFNSRNRTEWHQDPIQFLKNRNYPFSESEHLCARGVYTYAYLINTSESEWDNAVGDAKGSWRNSRMRGKGNANSEAFFANLVALGYSASPTESDLSPGEIKAKGRGLGEGDIICYWNEQLGKMHTCIRRVPPLLESPGKVWVSDFLQNNMWVYTKYS